MRNRIFIGVLALAFLCRPEPGGCQNASEPEWEAYRAASDLMEAGKIAEARVGYDKFVGLCRPECSLLPRALFERAQCLIWQDKMEDGVREMIALAQRFPQHQDAPLALWCAVQFFIEEKPDKKEAWYYTQQILKNYPHHAVAEHLRTYWPSVERMSQADLIKQAKALKAAKRAAQKTAK